MAVVDRHGLPLAIGIKSASPHEVTLVEETIDNRFIDELPEQMIGDKAYDSDALDARLAKRGIELIAPNRANRRRRTQDGRQLRRYVRRWRVERFFAWLHNSRRLVNRWERKAQNFLGFLKIACAMMLVRHF